MAEATSNQARAPQEASDSVGGATLYPHPIVGIVKHNVDPLRMGQIRVLLKRKNGAYPEDIPSNWSKPLTYLSPFLGYTPNESGTNDYGSFAGNPHSYGMWFTPPDIGTEVLCIFANGDPNFGYYIGSIPKPGMNQMIPAIGAADKVILNQNEANSYGGATRLPVGEINNANDKQATSGTLADQPRPVHSFAASTYNTQGLLRDPDRGPVGSSAQRESPSRVFGISTPGRPIYAGGFNDANIKQAIGDASVPDSQLKVTGRVGGHSFVMDDGDVEGNDQVVRLRTALGHTILMNDAAQTMFIIHSNGQSYIELGKEGTIDMYSTNSVNIRTQGDLNLHADRDINMNAGRDLNIFGKNTHIESQENTTHFTGKSMNTTVLGTHSEYAGDYSLLSTMNVGFKAVAGGIFLTGLPGKPSIFLNSGMAPNIPIPGKQLDKVLHTDTLYDPNVGYAAAPKKLSSIVSRAPAHAPWASANMGVDVTTNLSSSSNTSAPPDPALTQINSSSSAAPDNTTTDSLSATVPVTASGSSSSNIDPSTNASMVSQMAVNAATGPAASAVTAGAGILNTGTGLKASIGSFALSPSNLVDSGHLKQGADVAVNAAINNGLGLKAAMPSNLFTGKDGVNSVSDLINNTKLQTNIASTLLNNASSKLTSAGILNGNISPSQSGGLIMSTAVVGLNATMKYASSTLSSLSSGNLSSISSSFSSLSDNISGSLSSVGDKISSLGDNIEGNIENLTDNVSSSIDNLMSGGLFSAASIEAKLNSSAVASFFSSLQGSATQAFQQVTSSFKPLTANTPISLAAVANGQNANVDVAPTGTGTQDNTNKVSSGTASETTALMDNAKGNNSSPAASDNSTLVTATGGDANTPSASTPQTSTNDKIVAGLPGGLSSISNIVKSGETQLSKIPGMGQVSSAVNNIASVVNSPNGAVGQASSLLTSITSGGGLVNSITSKLSIPGLSQVSGLLGSLGLGGPFRTILPTNATDTNKTAISVAAQTSKLLDNSKIPAPNYDRTNTNTQDAEAKNQQMTQINQAVANQQQALDNWNTLLQSKGSDNPETQSAYAQVVATTATLNNLTA